MRSFIIHMAGDTRRQENARTLLGVLPGAEIVAAINGREVMETQSPPLAPGSLHVPRYPFVLNPGEVGCFLSHRACWQRIVELDLPHALIAEDDLALDPAIWPDVLDLLSTHVHGDAYIRVPVKARETPVQQVAERNDARLFLPRVIGLQTVCQVVGRGTAQRLLEASAVMDRPVDAFLQMHWATGQPVHTILPNGTRELTGQLGGSTIQRKHGPLGKFSREIKRAIYRGQIWARPQRG